jgi:ketosteroid isomerase-like protein
MSQALECPALQGEDLLTAYWDAFTSLDADQAASQFDEGGVFCVAHNPPVRGRQAIRQAFSQLFVAISGIGHRPVYLWSHEGVVVDEADVTFTFKDGGKTTVPITTVLRTTDHQIQTCRLELPPEPALVLRTRRFASIAAVT